MFMLDNGGGIIPFIIFTIFMAIVSIVAAANKKRKESEQRAALAQYNRSPERSIPRGQSHRPQSVVYDGQVYDADLLPAEEEAPPPILKQSAPAVAIDAQAKRHGSAADAKAQAAEQRHREGHNLKERDTVIESGSTIGVRNLLSANARSAVLVAEILGPPRCRQKRR